MNKWGARRQYKRKLDANSVCQKLNITIEDRLKPPTDLFNWPEYGATEAQVGNEIEAALKSLGFREACSWVELSMAPATGGGFFWKTIQFRNTTTTDGLPDYIVGFARHPIIIGLEAKKRTSRGAHGAMVVSAEQVMPIALQTVYLIRSGEQAKWAIRQVWNTYIKPAEANRKSKEQGH
jgi:hypothetical protein